MILYSFGFNLLFEINLSFFNYLFEIYLFLTICLKFIFFLTISIK
jgi:hypothetical protein